MPPLHSLPPFSSLAGLPAAVSVLASLLLLLVGALLVVRTTRHRPIFAFVAGALVGGVTTHQLYFGFAEAEGESVFTIPFVLFCAFIAGVVGLLLDVLMAGALLGYLLATVALLAAHVLQEPNWLPALLALASAILTSALTHSFLPRGFEPVCSIVLRTLAGACCVSASVDLFIDGAFLSFLLECLFNDSEGPQFSISLWPLVAFCVLLWLIASAVQLRIYAQEKRANAARLLKKDTPAKRSASSSSAGVGGGGGKLGAQLHLSPHDTLMPTQQSIRARFNIVRNDAPSPLFRDPAMSSQWSVRTRLCFEEVSLLFGFQNDNKLNQCEHLFLLLANLQRRHDHDVDQALFAVHAKFLGNYVEWCQFLEQEPLITRSASHAMRQFNMSSPHIAASFFVEEDAAVEPSSHTFSHDSVTLEAYRKALTQEVALFLLIWGEASNLRHMPECLAFLFHKTAYELRLSRSGSMAPVRDEGSFLACVITPIYQVIVRLGLCLRLHAQLLVLHIHLFSLSLHIHPSFSLSTSIRLSLSPHPSIHLSLSLSPHPSIHLSLSLSLSTYIHISLSLSPHPSIHQTPILSNPSLSVWPVLPSHADLRVPPLRFWWPTTEASQVSNAIMMTSTNSFGRRAAWPMTTSPTLWR